MLRIKEILIFIILLSFMNISDIYTATKSTEVKKELSPEEIKAANKLLWAGIEKNKIGYVEEALAKGADVNYKESEMPALISALHREYIDIAKLLLKHNADVNAQNAYRTTALEVAIRSYELPIIKLLLKHGANTNIKDRFGNTPLIYTIELGNVERDRRDRRYARYEIIEMLLNHGADINARNEEGNTALIFSALAKYPDLSILEILLNHGADDTIKNNEGISFLDLIRNDYRLQKVVNEYKKRVQKEISGTETPFFPKEIAGLIAEYV